MVLNVEMCTKMFLVFFWLCSGSVQNVHICEQGEGGRWSGCDVAPTDRSQLVSFSVIPEFLSIST